MVTTRSSWDRSRNRYLRLLPVLLIVALAVVVRLYNLVPLERGLLAAQDYDEGVWNTTAQLWLQGHMPYRDFFATLPPGGIYLLAAVLRLVYEPWGSGLGLMATRYASAVYGAITVLLVYRLSSRIGGTAAGVVAAGVLAVDAMVVATDRLAMLEPPLNMFSALAVWAYHEASELGLKADRQVRWAALAGVFCGLAALAKTPGLVVLLSLTTVSCLCRKWRQAAAVVVGFVVTWLVLCAPFLLRCPTEFVRQVYVFQVLRPADGVLNRLGRLLDMWRSSGSWLTVRLGIVGAFILALSACLRRNVRRWWAVLAWAGYTLLLMVTNRSYYAQYYAQLAVPLSILAGGLVDARIAGFSTGRLGGFVPQHLAERAGQLVIVAVLFAGAIGGSLTGQAQGVVRVVTALEATYVRIADEVREHSEPSTRVLAFEPSYTFLASRPPSGARAERFLVDSYGEMLYLNLGVESLSPAQLLHRVLSGSGPELQATFWRRPAQEAVLAAFQRADLVVLDGRARYQLEPQTMSTLQEQSVDLASFGVAAVRRRVN
jgi:4-amino-4-deoxy-L-arabinose transferase-like glycosyltransferase